MVPHQGGEAGGAAVAEAALVCAAVACSAVAAAVASVGGPVEEVVSEVAAVAAAGAATEHTSPGSAMPLAPYTGSRDWDDGSSRGRGGYWHIGPGLLCKIGSNNQRSPPCADVGLFTPRDGAVGFT